ncbi:MAG: DedA family protein [Wolbachia sp.]|nr:DedA family protein [Wolbachia sp.]MDD9336582.1 DedA family protein [Wolbachia sp.]
MENCFLLFKDNLLSSLILPIRQDFTFKTMLYFKSHYNLLLMLLFGVLGSSLGGIINWCLGKITIYIRKSYHKLENEHITSKTIENLLISSAALLSWVPALGSVVQVLSGYFKLNLYIFIPLIISSNFFYLLYLILTA